MPGFDSIVLLSPFPWNGAWQTTHFLAHHLESKVPTVFVEPRPGWNPYDSGFALGRLLSSYGRPRLNQTGPSLYTLTPPTLPFGRFACVAKANRDALIRAVRRSCQKLTIRNPLFWVFYYPGCRADLNAAGMPPFVYHCVDYFEHGDEIEERELARKAALVLSASEPLVARHQKANPRTYLLPNGVTNEWFGETTRATPTTDLCVGAGQRVIGFVGNLSRHVDFPLLGTVARALPSAHLVLIEPILRGLGGPSGDQRHAMNTLRSLPNVQFLGFRPPQTLPSYIKRFDVCLLPFRTHPVIAHADPAKFYQYLAAAKPIVTMPIPVAQRYRSLCYVASNHGEFVESIRSALNESPGSIADQRLETARTHDWQRLVGAAYERARSALAEIDASV